MSDRRKGPPAIGRRSFLQGGLATVGGLLGGRAWGASAPRYKVTGWSGDEYELGHRLRDGQLAKRPKVSRRHDVVIVGAGASGLTAAFKLRHLDTLVLDQASSVGGNSKAGRRGAVEFNIGAAYFTGVDGVQGALWDELGYKPQPMASPTDRWRVGGKWIAHPWSLEGIAHAPAAVQGKMRALRQALEQLLKGKDFPNTPYERATPAALKLDKITFAEWLKPYAHPDLFAFIDSYCHSALGGSMKTISAFAGLNFYSEFLGDIYGFTEGNYGVIKLLTTAFERAGKGRIATKALAYRVERAGSGVRVYYTQGGESHAVEARRAILAVPFFVAARLIADLAEDQRYALNMPGYCAYVVGNLIFDREICFDSFDSWVPGLGPFDDFITSTWTDKAQQQRLREAGAGQAISLFAPTRRPSLGRYLMMTRKPADFAAPMVEAFARLYPQSKAHLKEVHLTRWGHAILINQTGMYTRWLPRLKKQHGPLLLAHSDGQALPALESSTLEATTAAAKVLAGWKRR